MLRRALWLEQQIGCKQYKIIMTELFNSWQKISRVCDEIGYFSL